MYEIRPESIKTFIEDKTIKLPRFQRKQTWDEKKNFQLAISIFKGFPIGVVVINREYENRKIIKWLLDGRQRRNALIEMLTDPENIYIWGKKFIGIRISDDDLEIESKFWKKMEEYLGEEDKQDANNIEDQEQSDDCQDDQIVKNDLVSLEEDKIDIEKFHDLDQLLKIIILIHKKTFRYSGFTRPFDFIDHIKNLSYIEMIDGAPTLSSKKLRTWISEYRDFAQTMLMIIDLSIVFRFF